MEGEKNSKENFLLDSHLIPVRSSSVVCSLPIFLQSNLNTLALSGLNLMWFIISTASSKHRV
jgi:hypothetical protein